MNNVDNEYWLFAKPILKNDDTRINYQIYRGYIENGEKDGNLSFVFIASPKNDPSNPEYIDNKRPCLVLKNLFADLFKGNNAACHDGERQDGSRYAVERLIDAHKISSSPIEYFFPFFIPRKEYISRFNTRKNSKSNPYANQLYSYLCEAPKECIGEIENACEKFFEYDCSLTEKSRRRLNKYLISRLKIFTDYLLSDGNRGATRAELNSNDIRLTTVKKLNERIDSLSGKFSILLSRLLIIAGLNWERINSSTLELLILGVGKDEAAECDKLYISYCEENKTDINDLKCAFDRLSPDAKYYKEISADYAAFLIKSERSDDHSRAYKILTDLCKKHSDYGRCHYLLALCLEVGLGCNANPEKAEAEYERAAELSDADALLQLAERAYRSEKSEEKRVAIGYCEAILSLSPSASKEYIGRAAFMIAEINMSVIKDKARANFYYRISAEASYSPAKYRLRALNRPNRPSPNDTATRVSEEKYEKHIIVSGCEDSTESIRSALSSSEWQITLLSNRCDGSDIRIVIEDFLDREYGERLSAEEFPYRSVFVFADTDEDINLRNTLYLLDRLYNKYIDILISSDNEKQEKTERLMSSFDVYVSADYETASTMIDSSLAEMGEDVYFKVHICDINKSHAEKLLYRAPLFIPTMCGATNPNVVVFGHSDFIYSFIREATASCFMEKSRVSISAIGANVSRIENKFKQDCGGIFTTPLERKIKPSFYQYDTARAELDDIASGRFTDGGPFFEEINDVIAKGNYFVIDVGSDMENLIFAKNLRTWLLRSDCSFRRTPFIAVRCRDSVNAFWIKRLHSGGRQDQHWYSDYDFYIFGMLSDIYPSVINDEIIERLSLGVHLSYGNNSTEREIARFWQSSYRRDSSRATAIGLVYRLYEGGSHLQSYRDYHHIDFNTLRALAEDFDKRLRAEPKLIGELALAEQARWNCFMLTRGWLSASVEQVRSYCGIIGHSSHKHELAKLHPYICDWEKIEDEDGLPARIRKIIPHSPSPRESTVGSIINTVGFFGDICQDARIGRNSPTKK